MVMSPQEQVAEEARRKYKEEVVEHLRDEIRFLEKFIEGINEDKVWFDQPPTSSQNAVKRGATTMWHYDLNFRYREIDPQGFIDSAGNAVKINEGGGVGKIILPE